MRAVNMQLAAAYSQLSYRGMGEAGGDGGALI
jgi:hypothetical protein